MEIQTIIDFIDNPTADGKATNYSYLTGGLQQIRKYLKIKGWLNFPWNKYASLKIFGFTECKQ